MDNIHFYNKKIGILGGGQLGKMLCQVASNWHVETFILDPSSECSAANLCSHFIKGDFTDYEVVYNFGKLVDIVTIEIENVNIEALLKLEAEGKSVYPNPHALKIIQDKGLQKEFYLQNNLSSSPFILCNNKEEIIQKINDGLIQFPFVQKSRKEGYDGKGVVVINESKYLTKLLDTPSLIEEKVIIKKEISIIAVRDINGMISCFSPVEMIFDEEANLVKYLLSPAQINDEIANKAIELATKTIKAFDLIGILAVEMFLDKNDNILINEVAPRPHNSGHQTIENTVTSQYEQQLRAILGLPLGSTEIILPSVMLNVLGEPNYSGAVIYDGLEECMQIPGINVHLYGKKETRPFRKMGHITIVNNSLEEAKKNADFISNRLKVIA